MTVHERISALRNLMKERGIDAFIIPSEDPHGSEYVNPHWQSRKWISGFTGSAGIVVITKDKAVLWTDFRYYIQAALELKDSGIELYKMGLEGVPAYDLWLTQVLNKGDCVGINSMNFSAGEGDKLKAVLDKSGVNLEINCPFIDFIWTNERPELPVGKVELHDIKYCGISREDKLKQIRTYIESSGATHHILSSLEDICWLYNIRGADLDTIPVLIGYSLITPSKAYIFADKNKFNKNILMELEKASVYLLPYEQVGKSLSSINKGSVVLGDKDKINMNLISLIPDSCEIKYTQNPTFLFKSIKNNTEIENTRNIMEHDGAAMVRFLKWMEENISNGVHTELSLASKLKSFREMAGEFAGESFTPIPGYRGHGALCHYSADKESQYTVDSKGGLFLIDSGGQYRGGTTDITRTLTLGNRTKDEIHDYTLVLKGHIALSMAKFPAGTRGYQLDLFARMAMWKEGIDYGHGTGHGVGYYLSVHEGPQNISSRKTDSLI